MTCAYVRNPVASAVDAGIRTVNDTRPWVLFPLEDASCRSSSTPDDDGDLRRRALLRCLDGENRMLD